MSARSDDILAGGLVNSPLEAPADDDPISRVHRVASRINIPSDIAEDWLKLTGGIESGNRQYAPSGSVLTGPPTKQTGIRARGFGQVVPDPGTTTRRIGNKVFDLNDPDQNIEAGLRLFAAGGPDPIGRRLEYFGGAKARQHYEKTGTLPSGGDGYTTYQQYIARTMGPPQRQKPKPDILAGGLVGSEPTPETTPVPPALREMEAVARQAAGTGQTTAPTPQQTSVTPTSQQPAPPQQPQGRQLTPNDVLWHLGPIDDRRVTPRVLRVLNEAVREDERKKAAGEQVLPPDLDYQNAMRKKAGLPPLQYNLQRERTMQIGSLTLRVPNDARQIAPVYRPEDLGGQQLPQFTVPEIRTRTDDRFRRAFNPTAEEQNRATMRARLIKEETAKREGEMNSNRITPEFRDSMNRPKGEPSYFSKEGVEKWADEQLAKIPDATYEMARQKRVAGMTGLSGWAEYLAQAPKSLVLSAPDTAAGFVKGLAVVAKKLDDLNAWTYKGFGAKKEYEGKEVKDLALYQVGEAIQREARSLLRSDPDLEADFFAGQTPNAIGQTFSFVFGGWVTKAPKLTVALMGGLLTADNAYEEVKRAGGTENQAVNAGLVAGTLLGPTELIGMQGAMKAITDPAMKATWRLALKEALKEGRRDIVENVLQEMGQEWGQGIITGQHRTFEQVIQAGTLGGFGAFATVPTTLIANRPIKNAQPLKESADVVNKPDEAPIALPAEGPRVITPEKPSAITAQMDALTNNRGTRFGVLIPKGQSAPTKIPKGFVTTRTAEGVIIHPKELSSADVRELVDDGNSWRLVGHQNPDGPEATRIVIARSGVEAKGGIVPGIELMSSYVVPGQEQNAIEEMRAQFAPYEPTFEVGGAETATKAVSERSGELINPQGAKGGEGDAAITQGAGDRSLVDAKRLTDITQTSAFRDHGLRGLDVPSQRLVMADVLAALHDPEIRNVVVQTIPLNNVVDNLMRAESPSQVVLHDENMLQDAAPAGDEQFTIPVGIDTADALVRAVAEGAAKVVTPGVELRSGLTTGSPAVVTGEANLPPLESGLTGAVAEEPRAASNVGRPATERVSTVGTGDVGHEGESIPRTGQTARQPGAVAIEETQPVTKPSRFEGLSNVAAATEDASGSRKHYSNAVEMDVSAEEEKHWRSQMEPAELAQWDASQKFLNSRRAQRLLGEIENGQATKKTLRQLQKLGRSYGLEDDVINQHIRLAEGSQESAPERDREVSGEAGQATAVEGRPLNQSPSTQPKYSEAIQQAFADWRSRRAYIDNSGKYRVKTEGRSSGPIASWNKEVKQQFATVKEFHDAAATAEDEGHPLTGHERRTVTEEPATERRKADRRTVERTDAYEIFSPEQRTQAQQIIADASPEDIPAMKAILAGAMDRVAGEYVDEKGSLRTASGEVLFHRIQDVPRSAWATLRRWLHIGQHRVKRKGNVIVLGDEAAAALYVGDEQMSLGWLGEFNTAAEARARLARTAEGTRIRPNPTTQPQMVADLEKIRSAIQAALDEGYTSVVVALPQAARHEAFHASSFSRGGETVLKERHKDLNVLTDTPEYKIAARELLPLYRTPDPTIMVEEIAARIADGKHDELGLTRKQAIDWMSKWFTSFADTHGATTISQFQELAKDAQKALAAAIDAQTAKGESAGVDEDVRRLEERRESRAGPGDPESGPLFSLGPPKRRPKDALKRLEELAKERGQTLRESSTKTAVAEKPTRVEDEKSSNRPALTVVPPPARRAAASTEGQRAERSFPKTAESMGYRGGTDRDYSVLTNETSLESARRRLTRLGASAAAAELAQTENPGAEDSALGILLMQQFERTGQIGKAVAVASDLSRKLTHAGQFVQAASVITRLSPEGVLLHAQKTLKGKPLAEEVAHTIVQQAKAITDAERLVAEIQRQRPDIFGPNGEILPRTTATETKRDSGTPANTRKGTRSKVGKLQDRLAQMETDARARMQARAAAAQTQVAAAPPKGQRGASVNPMTAAADLGDLVIIGAAKLARKGITQAVWLAEMAKEASALTKKDLRRLYRESYELYERERRQFLQEARARGALRQMGVDAADPADVQRVINERLDAMTAARKARAELARTFQDLSAGRTVKILRGVRDVWGLTRALITSVDLSAGGRQGKMGLVSHPRAWLRGFARQFKALSKTQYERMVSEIQADPDYRYAVRFKLELTSVAKAETGNMAAHEEVYQTELADKIPWLRISQQAYDTMLDTLRFGWFKAQLVKLRTAGIDLEDPENKEMLIHDTGLINKFTGRGGDARLRRIAPTANAFAFSVRFWASRLEVLALPLNPRMYGVGEKAYSKEARVDAWKTVFGFYGLVALQIALARLAGAQVSFDPEDPDFVFNPDSADFLKVKFGPHHIDFSAGLQSHLRVAARLAKSFYLREFEHEKPRTGPADIVGKYLRSKEEPNVALIHDLFFSDKKNTENGPRGTNYAGEPVYLTGKPGTGARERITSSAIAQRVLPIVLQDALAGWKLSAGPGSTTLALAASTLGEGVTTYSKGYSEKAEKWPMAQELERLNITINAPQRVKPSKNDKFKPETEEEYNARRRKEAEAIKVALQRLEGMSFYKTLPDRSKEAAIRATITAARESVRYQQPAQQRKQQSLQSP
jgi:hypothetical protein